MASPRRDPLVPFDYSRSHLSPAYCRIARPLFRLFNLFYFSRRLVRWVENVPLHGPAILALNHPAVADIPFVGACVSHRRFAHFMSEEELFLNRFPFKLLASLITPLGAFPVDRRLPVDRRSISYAVDRLAEGSLLTLAPEGVPNGAGACFPSALGSSCWRYWPGSACYSRENLERSRSSLRQCSTGRPHAVCTPNGRCASAPGPASPWGSPFPWRISSLRGRKSRRSWTR